MRPGGRYLAAIAPLSTFLVLVVAVSLQATGAGPTRAERAVPFGVGETLDYDVGWSSYLTAGTATLSVREKKPSYGSTAYYVVAEGGATPPRGAPRARPPQRPT